MMFFMFGAKRFEQSALSCSVSGRILVFKSSAVTLSFFSAYM